MHIRHTITFFAFIASIATTYASEETKSMREDGSSKRPKNNPTSMPFHFGKTHVEISSRIVHGVEKPLESAHHFADPKRNLYGIVESAPGPLDKHAHAKGISFEQAAIDHQAPTQLKYELLGAFVAQRLYEQLCTAISENGDLSEEIITPIFANTHQESGKHNPFNNKVRAIIAHCNPVDNKLTLIALNRKTSFVYGPQAQKGCAAANCDIARPRNSNGKWFLSLYHNLPPDSMAESIMLTNHRFAQCTALSAHDVLALLGGIDPFSQKRIQHCFERITMMRKGEYEQALQIRSHFGFDNTYIEASVPTNILIVIPIIRSTVSHESANV